MPEAWLDVVARELAVNTKVDAGPLLGTAREIAHNVERKQTPLTTFLLGVAVGQQGANADLVALCERVSELARAWGTDADGRTS